ncbi:MAG: membrane integrity-associated transporter subunit PqiC [Betaproteobacteria bacterium]|nr:membrane integrity-associated transporter subunit PqiC [Betaproteobacteria bacterium]
MKTLIIFLAIALLAGCASGSKLPVETYDFGIAAAATVPPGQDVFVAEVRAAEWLSTTDMLYRLEYRDARILAPYAASRWAGAPAAMLTIRLRQSVGNGTSARGRKAKCSLTLFLSEFSQVFAAEQDSRAVMHMHATLTDMATAERALVREFRIERPALTPNAAGGAAAFSDIATSAAEELNAWITEAGTCKS